MKGPRRELLIAALRQHFSDERHIMWAPQFHESVEDLTHVKTGVAIGHRNPSPDVMEFIISQAGLRHRWKPKFRRVYHSLKYDTKEVKDPSWVEDARAFSKNCRRGARVTVRDLTMEFIDVDRESYYARKDGYNDIYFVRFL
jgi:hypothetical protein